MDDAQCYQCKRELDGGSVQGLCRSCLIKGNRCTVCGEPVDPFTKSAYLEPSSICIECRILGAEGPCGSRESPAENPPPHPPKIPSA